jgi:hypothetical protein
MCEWTTWTKQTIHHVMVFHLIVSLNEIMRQDKKHVTSLDNLMDLIIKMST